MAAVFLCAGGNQGLFLDSGPFFESAFPFKCFASVGGLFGVRQDYRTPARRIFRALSQVMPSYPFFEAVGAADIIRTIGALENVYPPV